MKMTVSMEEVTTPFAVIEHTGKSLIFDLGSYNKNWVIGENVALVDHINAYWASMPQYKQEKIYELYANIRNVFEEIDQTVPMCLALMPLIKQLYGEHDLDDLERWVVYHTDIKIPTKFDEAYVHTDEKQYTREKTYTRQDYLKLVVLTLSLRIMVPIWGEFIYRTKAETGTNHKEFYAYSLLAQTKLNDSPAIEKLRIYLESNIQADKNMTSVIVNGPGSEDYSTWVLSGLLVKRLSVGDIRGQEVNTDLVVTAYNDLAAKNNGGSGSTFGEPMLTKKFDSDMENDQGVSRIENFRIKAEHSTGDIRAIQFYMSNYKAAAKKLFPGIDRGLLQQFVKASEALQNEELWPAQITLAQWVLAPIISPRGLYHLDKVTTIKALAVAQTWLWQKGHKKLACLITAIASDNSVSGQLSGIGSMARISREQMEELTKLYPYSKVSAKRKNTTPVNSAVEAIDIVANNINTRDWILTVPDEFALEIIGSEHHRRYSCPHDIKLALAALSIELAKRT